MEQSCFVSSAITALLLLLVHGQSLFAGATTYTVGGLDGWTMEQAKIWPKGKSFKAGDYLEFTYNYEFVNVITTAKKTEYDQCKLPVFGIYQSGRDFIRLHRGHNYFFSGMGGQCQLGFKMAIFAE
ncbi:unnamed protein product [Linum tenue]|uniref:Phytocyanin domain-containing protein n=2 Tax=Linum TaxID=4005 RepID=A0AAV0GRL9_9ROSI|nr:unnamed protein product [Linum tenue]